MASILQLLNGKEQDFTVSLHLDSVDMVIKKDCLVQCVFKKGKNYQPSYFKLETKRVPAISCWDVQKIQFNHQFTKTVPFQYHLQDGKEVYPSNKAVLKINLYKLNVKDDYGDKYTQIEINMDKLICQGLQKLNVKTDLATFNFQISVVAQKGQTLVEHAIANIKPNTKIITGDQLKELLKHSEQTVQKPVQPKLNNEKKDVLQDFQQIVGITAQQQPQEIKVENTRELIVLNKQLADQRLIIEEKVRQNEKLQSENLLLREEIKQYKKQIAVVKENDDKKNCQIQELSKKLQMMDEQLKNQYLRDFDQFDFE